MSMSIELHVVLSQWLNAYEAAVKVDKTTHESARIKQLPAIIADLAAKSEALFRVADVETEAPRAGKAPLSAVEGHVVPSEAELASLVKLLVEWAAAHEAVATSEMPTNHQYCRVEHAERRLQAFVRRSQVLPPTTPAVRRSRAQKKEIAA